MSHVRRRISWGTQPSWTLFQDPTRAICPESEHCNFILLQDGEDLAPWAGLWLATILVKEQGWKTVSEHLQPPSGRCQEEELWLAWSRQYIKAGSWNAIAATSTSLALSAHRHVWMRKGSAWGRSHLQAACSQILHESSVIAHIAGVMLSVDAE